jgi:hypothetical protein
VSPSRIERSNLARPRDCFEQEPLLVQSRSAAPRDAVDGAPAHSRAHAADEPATLELGQGRMDVDRVKRDTLPHAASKRANERRPRHAPRPPEDGQDECLEVARNRLHRRCRARHFNPCFSM